MAGTAPPLATGPTSLAAICQKVLIRFRHCLGDVGYLETNALRQIMSHCGPEELRQIEDQTLSRSGRDLSWYSWDFWFRQYELKFGSTLSSKAELKPLPGVAPPDYVDTSSKGGPPTADWRRMLERDLAQEKARAAGASSRIRSLYDAANKDKASRSAGEVCVILPPRKRMRTGNTSAPFSGPSALVDKVKHKMLYDIGMSKQPKLAPSSSGNRASSSHTSVTTTTTRTTTAGGGGGGHRGPSGPRQLAAQGMAKVTSKVTITRTVVVHKAQERKLPAAYSVAARPVAAQQGGGAGAASGSRPAAAQGAGASGRPASAPPAGVRPVGFGGPSGSGGAARPSGPSGPAARPGASAPGQRDAAGKGAAGGPAGVSRPGPSGGVSKPGAAGAGAKAPAAVPAAKAIATTSSGAPPRQRPAGY